MPQRIGVFPFANAVSASLGSSTTDTSSLKPYFCAKIPKLFGANPPFAATTGAHPPHTLIGNGITPFSYLNSALSTRFEIAGSFGFSTHSTLSAVSARSPPKATEDPSASKSPANAAWIFCKIRLLPRYPAAATSFAKPSGFRLAPPTSAPPTPASERMRGALSTDTLPP